MGFFTSIMGLMSLKNGLSKIPFSAIGIFILIASLVGSVLYIKHLSESLTKTKAEVSAKDKTINDRETTIKQVNKELEIAKLSSDVSSKNTRELNIKKTDIVTVKNKAITIIDKTILEISKAPQLSSDVKNEQIDTVLINAIYEAHCRADDINCTLTKQKGK